MGGPNPPSFLPSPFHSPPFKTKKKKYSLTTGTNDIIGSAPAIATCFSVKVAARRISSKNLPSPPTHTQHCNRRQRQPFNAMYTVQVQRVNTNTNAKDREINKIIQFQQTTQSPKKKKRKQQKQQQQQQKALTSANLPDSHHAAQTGAGASRMGVLRAGSPCRETGRLR